MKRLLPVLMGFVVLLLSSTEGWSLPPCPEKGVWNNCFGTYTENDGTTYVGEWKEDKSHGQGTETYGDGYKYVGEWKGGKKNGQGTFTYRGNKYVGEFKDGKENGQGTLTFPDGDKIVGQFKDGDPIGQGTVTYADGRVEEGIWENRQFKYAK